MKKVIWVFAVLMGIALAYGGLQRLASERIEVVELHTVDEFGETITTRLWVVDDEGYQYLRVGAEGSGWFSRLRQNGEFEISRAGNTSGYTSQLREDKSDRINQLMQEKYTWGDTLINFLLGGRSAIIPVELHRLDRDT